MAALGSDLLAKIDNNGGNVLSAAQAQASSVVEEASSVVTEISKAISNPTLVANMTADKACLEILSFSKCRETKIGAVFVVGFCFLAYAAAATAVMFFYTPRRPARAFGWSAIASGIIAIVVLEGLAVSAWIVVEVVSSILTDEPPDSNGRSIYLTFTCIAFFSVAISIIAHHHRTGGTFDGRDKQSNNNSSGTFTNASTDGAKPASKHILQYVPNRRPRGRHPSELPPQGVSGHVNVGSPKIVNSHQGHIPIVYSSEEAFERPGSQSGKL